MKHCPNCGKWAGVCQGETCRCKACGQYYIKHPRGASRISRGRVKDRLYPTENAITITELLCNTPLISLGQPFKQKY